MGQWEINANLVADVYGIFVDWGERFYECPDCGDPVYESDWSDEELAEELCPICGFCGDD